MRIICPSSSWLVGAARSDSAYDCGCYGPSGGEDNRYITTRTSSGTRNENSMFDIHQHHSNINHENTKKSKIRILNGIPSLSSSSSSSSSWCRFVIILAMYLLGWIQPPLLQVGATLIVGNVSFDSMPGLFGLPWRQDSEYRARMQFLPENPYLCEPPPMALNNYNNLHQISNSNNNTTGSVVTSSIVGDTDGYPVALLAKRGNCSFGQKAQMAMAYQEAYRDMGADVHFCIVYDNEPRSNLVAMQAFDYDSQNVRIHTMFVSLVTGVQLRAILQDQTIQPSSPSSSSSNNITKSGKYIHGRGNAGGIFITMNADSPMSQPYYSDSEGQEWLVAAMAGFFGFLAFFGCLLVAVHAGYLPVMTEDGSGRIQFVFVGAANAGGSRISARSIMGSPTHLTHDQVSQLQLVEHGHHHLRVSDPNNSLLDDPCESTTTSNGLSMDETQQSCCSICMEDYEIGECNLIELPCSHRFHKDCIEPWLTERHATCPMCKFDMVEYFVNAKKRKSTTTTSPSLNEDGSTSGICQNATTTTAPNTTATTSRPVSFLTSLLRMGWTPVATTTVEAVSDESVVVESAITATTDSDDTAVQIPVHSREILSRGSLASFVSTSTASTPSTPNSEPEQHHSQVV